MSIIRRRKTAQYSSLHNGLLQDKRLSYSARGLASYLLSLPEDWTIVKEQLYNHSEKDGRKIVDRCFIELLQYGYMIAGYGYGLKKGSRSKRPVKQYEYIISDIPFAADEIDEFYLELSQKWKSVGINPCNYSDLSTVQKVQYKKNSTKSTPTKKDFKKKDLQKDLEEEEIITNPVTESMILDLMNQKIKEREITNQKTIKAIHDVVSKCKAIGTTDLTAAENYVIKVVEEKMSKLGQKQKVRTGKAKVSGSVRKEKLPKWMNERDQEEKENTSTNVMDESKLKEFKMNVLKIAQNMNLTIDVTSINLENYKVAGTYLDMGFDWKDIQTIFRATKKES
ncbi:hypothetical protein [Bacillus paranthracis]|uniref:Replication protein n=1 Tax=Bacillus paranthracis TaxID=2026186 RepID=A0AAJ1NNQ6_9BACI|nr:hypothetical protein [Bacillus paranthracis]MDG0950026.1 hypothetical protein [Bacillus paranthracis]MDG0955923.1 hypothetical protein [Bacillus paranthracis]